LLAGSSGWPLNVFALPDGRAFCAGTYFLKEQWISIMYQISNIWKNEPEKIIEQAELLTQGIKESTNISIQKNNNDLTINLELFTNNIYKSIDSINGGFNGAPKFPMPVFWNMLLVLYNQTKNDKLINMVVNTLDKMALGGIFDQLGGGFARYSVDSVWKVPHFEKMLYDNAQLISLYSLAYKITKYDLYKNIVYQTIEFASRELKSKECAWFSSLNADSEGKEGVYYTWKYDELLNLIPDASKTIFFDYYQIKRNGNWENGSNILYPYISIKEFAVQNNYELEMISKQINDCRKILLDARKERISPSLDDKVITAWNALMIIGLIDAYEAFEDPEFLTMANNTATFLKKYMIKDSGKILRRFREGNCDIDAFLDDYAITGLAFLRLYEATLNDDYFKDVEEITNYIINHFSFNETGFFNYSEDINKDLIANTKEINDNVIPSSNSILANLFFKLGHISADNMYLDRVIIMLNNISQNIEKYPAYFANWAFIFLSVKNEPTVISIGKNVSKEELLQVKKYYLPDTIFKSGSLDDKIILCKGNVCLEPFDSMSQVVNYLKI